MHTGVRALALARWRLAIALSAIVAALYFGFIFAVAFAKDTMAHEIAPGLSLGILAGAAVIIGAWLTTWFYVSWANRYFDPALRAINAKRRP